MEPTTTEDRPAYTSGTFPSQADEAPTWVELDPRYVDLVLRQQRALTAMTSRQARDRVALAIRIRREADPDAPL